VQAQDSAEHGNRDCHGWSKRLVNVLEIFGPHVVIDLHGTCARPVTVYSIPGCVRDPVLVAGLHVNEIPNRAIEPP
jgi:hypothetical protein